MPFPPSSEYDRSSVAALYQHHAPTLLHYIRRHISTREDAEDVLLEVFIAALESNILTTLNESEQLAWLHKVAHNKCVDAHRRSMRHPILPLKELDGMLFDEEERMPESITMRQEMQALLRKRLSTLPPVQQEALRLRFADGLSCPEIARRMHKSNGAIRVLLSRSLNLLRTIYENSEEDTHHVQER